jgi:hypothetical protein
VMPTAIVARFGAMASKLARIVSKVRLKPDTTSDPSG